MPLVYDVQGLEVALGGRPVLGPIDLEVARGAFLGILGPNGSGKTTLLRVLAGSVRPQAGTASLLGRPIQEFRAAELARLVGVVPQEFNLDFSFTVAEMVAMGRYAHGGRALIPAETLQAAGWQPTGREQSSGGRDGAAAPPAPPVHRAGRESANEAAVAAALADTGLSDLAGRPVTQLSGGERQRALIAQTLAQQSPILLFDEPLNNLDLNHQLEVMQLLARLNRAGRTVIVVLHDLNIAAQYCERMVLLDRGQVAAQGGALDILDPQVILEVFRVRVAVHRQGSRPYLTPLWTKLHDSREAEKTKAHVIAGGGAASELIEELVLQGLTPSVGVVSVFDTDYVTAERYELEVISAPPFQAFPGEAVEQMETLVNRSDVLLLAPVFFGTGNMELLRVAVETARRGVPVIFVDAPGVEGRDLTGGEAVSLVEESLRAGAVSVPTVREAVEAVLKVRIGPSNSELKREPS